MGVGSNRITGPADTEPADTERSADAVFGDFYRREHQGQVRRAYLLTGSRSVADDLVHDAFVAVYERWSSIESPGGYLNRTVLNACAGHTRRRNRVAIDDVDHHEVSSDRSAADFETVEFALLLVVRLPFRQRAAIVLRFYGGMTETEIAAALGCRPGTVGPLIHRGLKRLEEALS